MENSNGKNKWVAGVVVAIVAIVGIFVSISHPSSPAPVSEEQNVGGERAGLQDFNDGIRVGKGTYNTNGFAATVPVGANQVVIFTNNIGRDVIVDYSEVSVTSAQTASSSYTAFVVATSSTVGAWADYGAIAPTKAYSIGGVAIATSTTASTTDSVFAIARGSGNGSVLVPAGQKLVGYFRLNTTACNPAVVGLCEVSTSTNRGFNPVFRASVHW